MKYHYQCDIGAHEFASPISVDGLACLEHGTLARRVRAFGFQRREMARDRPRWDPVVGRYVSNQRQFLDALKEGVERESEEMHMEVRVVPVDAADTTALCEMHGQSKEDRAADLEPTLRAEHDKRAG